jgi:hypothetical protein
MENKFKEKEENSMQKTKYLVIAILLALTCSNVFAVKQTIDRTELFVTGIDNQFLVRSDGSILSSGGVVNCYQEWNNPSVSTTVVYLNVKVATTTLISGGSTYSNVVQPTGSPALSNVGRCISAAFNFDVGNGTHTAMAGTLTITGISSRGNLVSEVVTLSSGMAFSNYGYVTINSLVVVMTSCAGELAQTTVNVFVGYGDKIGLINDVINSADVYKVTEAGVNTTTYVVDPTYDTIDFVTNPDNTSDYQVYYRAKGR